MKALHAFCEFVETTSRQIGRAHHNRNEDGLEDAAGRLVSDLPALYGAARLEADASPSAATLSPLINTARRAIEAESALCEELVEPWDDPLRRLEANREAARLHFVVRDAVSELMAFALAECPEPADPPAKPKATQKQSSDKRTRRTKADVEALRDRVRKLEADGLSNRDIATNTGISENYVSEILSGHYDAD